MGAVVKYFIVCDVNHPTTEEDPLDRELQSKELARVMASSYPRPVIFLGYVVTKPGASRRKFHKYIHRIAYLFYEQRIPMRF